MAVPIVQSEDASSKGRSVFVLGDVGNSARVGSAEAAFSLRHRGLMNVPRSLYSFFLRGTVFGFFLAGSCLLALLVSGCASSGGGSLRQVPENGYHHSQNYRFQAQVQADSLGRCQRIVVRVRPISKLYTRGKPPSRLQLVDEDCYSPVRFENARYLSDEGNLVQLSGFEVDRFLDENFRLEDELTGWLWREGLI